MIKERRRETDVERDEHDDTSTRIDASGDDDGDESDKLNSDKEVTDH